MVASPEYEDSSSDESNCFEKFEDEDESDIVMMTSETATNVEISLSNNF